MNATEDFASGSLSFVNSTSSFTSTHVGSYELPFTTSWVIALTFFIVVFFIFGVAANAITIAVIQQSSRLNYLNSIWHINVHDFRTGGWRGRSRYYAILTSMCISDITSAFISILFLYRRTWGFLYFYWPEFFCRLYWGMDLWTSFATALHILSFAILRLIGVKWPTVFRRISKKTMKVWIGSIWGFTFLGGFIPHFLFNTVNNINRDREPHRARWASCSLSEYWFSTWQVYVQIAYAVYLYLPALGIIAISIAITVLLRRTHPPGNQHPATISSMAGSSPYLSSPSRNKKNQPRKDVETAAERRLQKNKQAIYQLILIVGSFLFGYIPLTAFHFYTGFTLEISNTYINMIDWRFAMIQYLLLRFSECLNPIFYNLASQKMRDETKKLLKKHFSCFIVKRIMVVSAISQSQPSKKETSEF